MICSKLGECINQELDGEGIKKCDNARGVCIESSDRRSQVKCQEKKMIYILDNSQRNHVISYKMDGGVISVDASVKEGIKKCDHLFVIASRERTAILIELKGLHVIDALKQIYETIKLYPQVWGKMEHVYGRVVAISGKPDLKATPAYVNLRNKLVKEFHGNLKIFERSKTEKDVDLNII